VAHATAVRPPQAVLDAGSQVAKHTPKFAPAESQQSPGCSKSVQSAGPRQAAVQ
jgi:hypothetical protein